MMFELFTAYIGEGSEVKIEFDSEIVGVFYTDENKFNENLNQEELYQTVFNVVKVLQQGDKAKQLKTQE